MKSKTLALAIGIAVIFTGATKSVPAQMKVEPPLMFGYFQNTLALVDGKSAEPDYTSFSVQQLNIMMQKELAHSWTAFINLEFVNSFSTSRMFGDLNLEEAWVRYRINPRLNLKMGLLTPEFNRLNSIKTKMPLLPYIIRPLVYESSVSESIPIHEYVPDHAYVSLSGTLPVGSATIEHAVYAGNSPNMSTKMGSSQSAVDTSMTFLTGFRLGARTDAIQAGVSGTLDFVDYSPNLRDYIRNKEADLTDVPRYRFGSDLRFGIGPLTFEGEMIKVWYDDDISETLIDKSFYYATALFAVDDKLTLYAGYWYTEQDVTARSQSFGLQLINFAAQQRIPGGGASYSFNDQVTAKVQVGKVDEDVDSSQFKGDQFDFFYYGFAASVMF